MTIVLSVDNFDALPDGGPMQYQADRRGFDIGRDAHLDWSLQDPNRHISGKHCEIRFENGQYALYDMSTNGTFLNGSSDRVKSPQILRNGDRLNIGQYVIAVHVVGIEEVSGQAATPSPANAAPPPGNVAQAPGDGNWMPAHQPSAFESDDIWASDSAAPAPIDRRDLIPPKQRGPREAGYESHFVELPQAFENPGLIADQPSFSDPFATPEPTPQQPQPAPQPAPQAPPVAQTPPMAQTPPAASAPEAWASPAPTPGKSPESPPSSVFDPGPVAAPDAGERPAAPADMAEPVAPKPLVEVSKPPMGFAGMEGESEPFAPQMPRPASPDPANPAEAGGAAPPAPAQSPDGPSGPDPASLAASPAPATPPPAAQTPLEVAQAQPAQAAAVAGGLDNFIPLFARGARINPADLSHLDPAALAEEVGAVMRIVVEHLAVLLAARAKAKMITKSANRTMLVADGNNPLKFLPTADEILTVMFARSRRGFKDARGSVTEAFADLEKHEFATIFAMQKALGKLLEDVSPEAIESDIAKSVFSSKQAKAWELYVQRWDEKNEPHENGVLDVFLEHFADFYDQQSSS